MLCQVVHFRGEPLAKLWTVVDPGERSKWDLVVKWIGAGQDFPHFAPSPLGSPKTLFAEPLASLPWPAHNSSFNVLSPTREDENGERR